MSHQLGIKINYKSFNIIYLIGFAEKITSFKYINLVGTL